MDIERRIEGFVALGEAISTLSEEECVRWEEGAVMKNPWFTPDNVRLALKGVVNYLDNNSLREFLARYSLPESERSVNVGIVMAGNIPLVGFHDLLVTLLAGCRAHIKTSESDSVLLRYVLEKLYVIDAGFRDLVVFPDKLNNMDAVIATGSDNTARYFDYYFRNIPHIIRKNRVSAAVLTGEETQEDFAALAKDIFQYYGLGCRNVSRLYVPEGYDFTRFFEGIEHWKDIIHHHKYCNNYEYRKSILLVNREPHLDNGFLLLQQNAQMVSPISMLYYDVYQDRQDARRQLEAQADKIQCIVSRDVADTGYIPLGNAQQPGIHDFADGVDTMAFLLSF